MSENGTTGSVEELNIKITGDESSLDLAFTRGLKKISTFTTNVEKKAVTLATAIKSIQESTGDGLEKLVGVGSALDKVFSNSTKATEGTRRSTEQTKKATDEVAVSVRRLEIEYKAQLTTLEQYKKKLGDLSKTSEAGSIAQMSALAKLKTIEEQEAAVAKRAADQKIRDAEKVAAAAKKAADEEARIAAQAARRGNPVSQAILTARYNLPGSQAQPLIGRTGAALGLNGDQTAVAALAGGAVAAMGAMAFAQAKEAIRLAADFEEALNVLGQQSGATGEQLDQMREKARELGADTTLPATSSLDAANAMLELSKAGLSVEDSMNGARGSLELAAAANIQAGEAATIVASQLKAFGLAGTEAGRVADLLAATAANSLGDIGDMAQAAQQASTAFAQAKVPIEDMYTSIGLMANAGIKGSDAGTSLRVMMTRLMAPTDEAKKVMTALGLKIYDANGQFVGIRNVIGQFERKMGDATDQQKKYVAQTVFGEDAQRAFNVVLDGGVKKFDDMAKNATKLGAAEEAAAARAKGFKGAVDGLGSAWQSFLEENGAPVLDFLTSTVHWMSKAVDKLGEWQKGLFGVSKAQEALNGKNAIASFQGRAKEKRDTATSLMGLVNNGTPQGEKSLVEKAAGVATQIVLGKPAESVLSNGILPQAKRKALLNKVGLPWNASDEEIKFKANEIQLSASQDDYSANRITEQYEGRASSAIKKQADAYLKAEAERKRKNKGGKGNAIINGLMNHGKKHKGGAGSTSLPSYVDIPELEEMPEKSGKRSYQESLGDIDDHFATIRAKAAESGKAIDEYSLTIGRLQQRLGTASHTIQETGKQIADLTPKFKANETAYIAAGKAYNDAAEVIRKKRLHKEKVSQSEQLNLNSLGADLRAKKTPYERDKALLDATEAVNRDANRQATADTEALAKAKTEHQSKQREGYLKKQKELLDSGKLSVGGYESELKASMGRILEAGGDNAVNSPDYQAYREALSASEASRNTLDTSIRQKTKGDTKEDRIAALDAEVAEMRKKGAEEVGVQAYYDDQKSKINQKFFADTQRDLEDSFRVQLETGEKSAADYRQFLVDSLGETKKVFGENSKEAAKLNMEILRLDWQGVDDQARGFKEQLDEGTISLKQYIAAIQGLQQGVSSASAPWRNLQHDIDEANKRVRDGQRRTADEIGSRVGDAAVAVFRGKSKIGDVIKDTVSGALDDAIKDSVKRWASKAALGFLGQKDQATVAREAADKNGRAVRDYADAVVMFGNWVAKFLEGQSTGSGEGSGSGGSGSAGAVQSAVDAAASASDASGDAADAASRAADVATRAANATKNASTKKVLGQAGTGLSVASSAAQGDLIGAASSAANAGWLGKTAAAAAPWLAVGLGVLSLAKDLIHPANKPDFLTKTGEGRYAIGSGDHTGFIDSGYSGTDGMRMLKSQRDAAAGRAQAVNQLTLHPGAIVINAHPNQSTREIADMVISRMAEQTSIGNALRGND